jgi:hypothetical protein
VLEERPQLGPEELVQGVSPNLRAPLEPGRVGTAARVELPPRACRSLELLLEHRAYLFSEPLADPSPASEGVLPPVPSAGLAIGRRPHRWVVFLLLDGGWRRDVVEHSVTTLRAGLGLRLLQERVGADLRHAAELQESLLSEAATGLPGYEIAFRTVPVDEVSGDFCDFVQPRPDRLRFAMGDASGHGLSAAVIVRDAVTGLRMGCELRLPVEARSSRPRWDRCPVR